MNKLIKLLAATLVAAVGFVVSVSPTEAFAADNISSKPSSVKGVSQRQMREIEKEVRFIFEEASHYENGHLWIDEAKLKKVYGVELGTYVAAGIREIYTNNHLAQDVLVTSQDRSFWSCMKNEVVGLIPGVDIYQLLTSGDLKSYIEGKAWGKVAEILAKELVKYGLRENVAGIVASIAISAGKCYYFG